MLCQLLAANFNVQHKVKCLLQNLSLKFKPQLKSSAKNIKWHISSSIGLASQKLAWNCRICQVSKREWTEKGKGTFRKGKMHLSQTALLSMYDKWVRTAENGYVSEVVLLDLSAAFDLVEPDILIKKIENIWSWCELSSMDPKLFGKSTTSCLDTLYTIRIYNL